MAENALPDGSIPTSVNYNIHNYNKGEGLLNNPMLIMMVIQCVFLIVNPAFKLGMDIAQLFFPTFLLLAYMAIGVYYNAK